MVEGGCLLMVCLLSPLIVLITIPFTAHLPAHAIVPQTHNTTRRLVCDPPDCGRACKLAPTRLDGAPFCWNVTDPVEKTPCVGEPVCCEVFLFCRERYYTPTCDVTCKYNDFYDGPVRLLHPWLRVSKEPTLTTEVNCSAGCPRLVSVHMRDPYVSMPVFVLSMVFASIVVCLVLCCCVACCVENGHEIRGNTMIYGV
jgi:hypothetical protein